MNVGHGGSGGDVKSPWIDVDRLTPSSRIELSAVARLIEDKCIAESLFDIRYRFGRQAAGGGGGTGRSGIAPALCAVILPPRRRVLAGWNVLGTPSETGSRLNVSPWDGRGQLVDAGRKPR